MKVQSAMQRRREQAVRAAPLEALAGPGSAQGDFPPLTVSRDALMNGTSDQPFRVLVDRMLAFGAALQKAREALARALGVTPPQYGMLQAIARHRPGEAISVGELAELLRVSLPFVVTQTGHLVRGGYLLKQTDKRDRRRVNLALTRRSFEAIRAIAPMQVRINDALFGSLSREEAEALSTTMGGLLASAEVLAAGHEGP